MNATRPTLLVIDDEPEVLRSVHDLLRLDYKVITCSSGAEAIRVLEGPGEIHVVMSDQRMPGMSGVEVLRQARELHPDAIRLIFTAYADIRAVIDAINQGHVYRYINKPWEPDELETIVRQAVEQHNLIVERDRLMAELQETNRRLVEANRLKGAFIEVASHELNTPVAVVLGMTELWKMSLGENASPVQRGWLERIQGAGKRLASTVERMLKLLRADEFSHTLELREVALEPLVRGAVDEVAPFLRARDQHVELELDPALGSAEADPAKLADILANLLVNAVKFTPDGGTIRIAAGPDGPDRVRFEITDPGIGIAPADRQHLFEPFFTGFDTMHHSSGDFQFGKRGIGLGLCLVKTFVELHGGDVEVESTPGRGSTFRFNIPRRPVPVRSVGAPAS
ncbi:MAG TPA: hybrid sensor histidine kinase/response regulator [Isosphaeraceae bacterium]|nr:hybrid sensor histidine kinase/response regulator [Isosphaeraceae bacterium]